MKNYSLAVLSVAAALAGCATEVRVDPVVLDNQEQIYRDGVPAIISRKGLVVMAAPVTVVREGKDKPKFIVSVANTSQTKFDLDTANFSASVDGKDLKVYTHQEVASDIKSKQAWAAFAVAMGGAMQAASAQRAASTAYNSGNYNTSTQGSFNAYGSNSNTFGNYNSNTNGTYSGWTYNPAAGQAAASAVNVQTNSNIASLQQQGKAALDEASQTMLKMTTVTPGSSHGGQIVLATFDVPETGAMLDLKVLVSGEEHLFRFKNQRYKK